MEDSNGGIDGYSRLVVFLRASSNNRSTTVLESFINAVARYGVPSRVRTDRGGENVAVWDVMNVFRGFHRGSAIQGRSVHNQCIERLWGDLWRGLVNVYHELFTFLESEGIVDPDNDMHLWALHYIYLPRLNQDLADFCSQWNNHGLRTEGHRTPLQIFVQGCLQQQGRGSTAMQEIFAVPPVGDVQPPPPQAAAPDPVAPAAQEEAALLDWPERVTVPSIDLIMEEAVVQKIQAQFDPLGEPRGQHGLQILRDLIAFLDSLP